MKRRPRIAMPLLALALASAGPALAQSPTGGTEAQEPAATTGGQMATVSNGAITLSARAHTLLGRAAAFRGHVPDGEAGRKLVVERFDRRAQAWLPATSTTVGGDGGFLARWRTDQAGLLRVRARLDGGAATAASASPELAMTVYRRAKATWYGPGFYGRRTACGKRMSRSLVGVAHKRLPCGTKVALLYKGRRMVVPVVDRGPFRRGTSWDLTAATARALGFTYTDRIGALRLRAPAK